MEGKDVSTESDKQFAPAKLAARIRANLNFSIYLAIATFVFLCLYFSIAPSAQTAMAKVYVASVAGYFGVILLGVNSILFPTRLSRFTRWIIPTIAWIWLVYLIIDLATFNIYRFHVNALLLEMFFADFYGTGVPLFLVGTAIAVLCLTAGIIVFLDRLSLRKAEKHFRFSATLACLALIAFGLNSAIHIWANYYDRDEITQINPLFPAYFPVTSQSNGPLLQQTFPSVFPAQRGQGTAKFEAEGGILNYPAQPLTFDRSKPTPSILMVLLESWQADSLTPEIMPNLCRFSETASRFETHVSGGSTTVPGMFSLLYGLHPNYYEHFKAASNSNPCILTEELHERGYASRVFTTSNLNRFSLRSLFFSRVQQEDYHHESTDEAAVDRMLESLKDGKNSQQPRFDFVFLTSSHSPYLYPEGFAKFQPLPTVEGGFALNKQADATPYKNDYHNSLHYSDALVGRILEELENQGRLENTLVLITGDHAEEFNETGLGYWGHGSNFTRWQTQTPMIVKSPGQSTGYVEDKLSVHQDVVPTILQDVLHCTSPLQHYTNGTHLSKLPESRGTVFASYFASAYLVDGVVVEAMSGREYEWKDMAKAKSPKKLAAVRTLMDEQRRFLH